MSRSKAIKTTLSRRQFLKASAGAAASLTLAACAAQPAAVPTAPPVQPTQAPTAPTLAATPTSAAPAATAAPAFKTGGILYEYAPPSRFTDMCDFTNLSGYEQQALDGSRLLDMTVDMQQFRPALAQSWEKSADGLSYTFHLRQNVKWSDGEPFTANDVQWTLSTIAYGKVASTIANYLTRVAGYQDSKANKTENLAGVKIVDPNTIRIEMSQPDALFLNELTYITIRPEHILGSVPRDQIVKHTFWSQQRVGTGPFKLSKYTPGQRMDLVANENYWEGRPRLDGFTYVIFADATAAEAAMQRGDLQTVDIDASEADRMSKLPNIQVVGAPYYLNYWMIINFKRGALGDKRFRQALAYAIDRDAIIKQIFKGYAIPIYGVSLQKAFQNPNDNHYAPNKQRSMDLLKQVGWDNSKELSLMTRYPGQVWADVLAVMQQQLADVGIKTKLEQVDANAWQNRTWDTENYDLGIAALGMPIDPSQAEPSFKSGFKWPEGRNISGYSNPKVDALFAQSISEVDDTKRKQELIDLDGILNDELPHVFLWDLQRIVAVDKRAVGRAENIGPTFIPHYRSAHLWWLNT